MKSNVENPEAFVTSAISSNPVVIFSKSYCPFCVSAKTDIANAGKSVTGFVPAKVFELDQMGGSGRAIQQHLGQRTGRSTVPNVFIGGVPVGGGDEIGGFARRGVLEQMLTQAPQKLEAIMSAAGGAANAEGSKDEATEQVNEQVKEENPQKGFVDEEAARKGVVIFSKSYCSFCDKAKALVQNKLDEVEGSEPATVLEMDKLGGKKGRQMQKYLLEKTGQNSVPNIFISGNHIGGFDALSAMEEDGRLGETLREVFGTDDVAAVETKAAPALKEAVFGAGCFWGVELAFQRLEGVVGTEVGYSNGVSDTLSYEDVCSGTTNAAEVVKVRYDPAVVSFGRLVEVWDGRHDVSSKNQQGNDVGTQYRSAIFAVDDEQRTEAEDWKAQQEANGRVVTTDIGPVENYCAAEEYHQQYLEKKGQSAAKGASETIRCYG